jgi:hypothetical protein
MLAMKSIATPHLDAASQAPARTDLRSAAAAAARAAGPVVSRGALILLEAIGDASAMALVTPPRETPPREHRR